MDKKPADKKSRASKYEKKFVVDASFEEVIKLAMGKKLEPKTPKSK